MIKQIQCPKSPRSIQGSKMSDGLNELGARIGEATGYLWRGLLTGGNVTDNRMVGNNYFFQTGTCPSTGGDAACQGQPRFLYMRNIPTSPVQGMIPAFIQDSMDLAGVGSLYNNVTAPCEKMTLPVGTRIYDTDPYLDAEDFKVEQGDCMAECSLILNAARASGLAPFQTPTKKEKKQTKREAKMSPKRRAAVDARQAKREARKAKRASKQAEREAKWSPKRKARYEAREAKREAKRDDRRRLSVDEEIAYSYVIQDTDDNALANCVKKCKIGWWPETRCSPAPVDYSLQKLGSKKDYYEIPVTRLYKYETFRDFLRPDFPTKHVFLLVALIAILLLRTAMLHLR